MEKSSPIGWRATILALVLLLAIGEKVLAQEGGWSTPIMISTNTDRSWFSDVAVDGWGQPHVVWNSGRTTDAGQERVDLLMYSTLTDQGWLEPNDIIVPSYGAFTVRPAITVDSAGTLHLTFRSYDEIYYTNAVVSEAWSASSWTSHKLVSGAGLGSAYYSDVAVDERGGIHVVWNESVSIGTGERWLWFGTPSGGVSYDGRNWRSQEARGGLNDREVYAIVEDQNGVQWFGTDDGVYRFDGSTWQTFDEEDGLISKKVNAVAPDPDGRLWFGTDEGVSVYNPEAEIGDREWISYTVEAELPDSSVNTIVASSLGEMWLGTGNGLVSYDGQNWEIFTLQDGLVAAEILAIAIDTRGDVWVGTKEGVSQYDGRGWRSYTVESGLLSNTVTAIAVDDRGVVWFGTDKGLGRFDGQEWMSYTAGQGLVSDAITALLIDSRGTVWVGTEMGVSRYNGQTWEAFELPQEFTGQKITAIAEDRQVNAMCPLCMDIFYRRTLDKGKTWSAPLNLSNSFAGSVKPQVRVGKGDNVYVTWEEGEDWYLGEGYPVTSMYAHSPDGGSTWTEFTAFSSTQGAPQQITLGVAQEGNLVVVWRLPEEKSFYYYQLSTDNGIAWSEPKPIPGVIAKPWKSLSLDAYHTATDSAGNVHLLVLGYLGSLEEDVEDENLPDEEKELWIIHLIWNGSEWTPPTIVYASSDPPEWPRIDVGAGNQVYATWFTRDAEHIYDTERGRYKVWTAFYQADAPSTTSAPLSMPTPTPELMALEQATFSPTSTPPLITTPEAPGWIEELYTESDEVSRLLVALSPIAAVSLIIIVIRFGWFRRRK